MTNRTRTDILLIAGFCAFLFFYGLGQFGLIGADEPRYAQVAHEMLQRRDWITPMLGDQAWLEKPPLYYWQAMLAYMIFGVSDWSARVPAAVDATLIVAGLYLFLRKFRTGFELDGALVVASCAGIIGYARAASMDMALAATFTGAMLAWWAWRESGHRRYLAFFYVALALGMLAKGPVAPFLAAVVIALYAAAVREWRLIIKTLWMPGILLFLCISLPWYIAVQLRNPEFFRVFILEHNLARFSTDLYHHPEPFWYYVPITLLALIPWMVFVTETTMQVVRAWLQPSLRSEMADPASRNALSLFACCWLVVPVVFFSMSQSKLPGYILPALPAGGLLLAEYLKNHLAEEPFVPAGKLLVVLHALQAALPFAPALLIAYLIAQHHLPEGRSLVVALGVAFALSVGIALTLMSRLGLRMLRFVTLIPVVLMAGAVLKIGAPALDQNLSARPLAHDISSLETHRLPLAVYGISRETEYGLTFYRNQLTIRYEWGKVPAEEHLLVLRENSRAGIAQLIGGRRISFLGNFGPQHLDYFWVSAAGAPAKP